MYSQFIAPMIIPITAILAVLFKLSYDAYLVRKEFKYRRSLIDTNFSLWKDYKKEPPTDIAEYIVITDGIGMNIVRYGDSYKSIYKCGKDGIKYGSSHFSYLNNEDVVSHWMNIEEAMVLLSVTEVNPQKEEVILPKPIITVPMKRDNPKPKYMKNKEAAEFLGVTGNTLRNWTRGKKISSHTIANEPYPMYKKEDLEKLLKSIREGK